MLYYKTFKRSCTDWAQFARARKITVETGLTYRQAKLRCSMFNCGRSAAQRRKGTMLEFTVQ